jgi:tetratricopeptide (TPR) repeat protein
MSINYRTSSGPRHYLTAFLYFCLIFLLGAYAVKQSLSFYYLESAYISGSDSDATFAVDSQPDNPRAHEIRGLLFLRNGDRNSATRAFESALALRPNSFLLWLRLGYAQYKSANIREAEEAYRRALLLAPNYSQTNLYMGKMLLETGRSDQAFPFLSKAAEYDNDLYPQVLHFARLAYSDDPLAIENAVWPASASGRLIVARYFLRHSFLTPNLRAYFTGGELSGAEKDEVVRSLIGNGNFRDARSVWLSKTAAPDTPIFDGGFEQITQSDESGLGWQVNQRVSASSVARDQHAVHSGLSALKIKFTGGVQVTTPIVSQLAYVEPHRKYQLKLFVRVPEMISAGLPAIVVSGPASDEVLGRSSLINATGGDWMEMKVDFVSGDSPVANISLQRTACAADPCPIFGELSLDDFSLTEN